MKGVFLKRISIKLKFMILVSIISLIVIRIGYLAYLNYENTIVEQQETQLMNISKSIGRSLKLFVYEKEKALKELANNIEDHFINESNIKDSILNNKLHKFYIDQNKEISTIIYVDLSTKKSNSHPIDKDKRSFILNQTNFMKNIKNLQTKKESIIGKHYLNRSKQFSFNIYVPVIVNNYVKGIIVGQVNLDNMYELLVKPVKVGVDGYVVINGLKDSILMHPVKEQIGYDANKIRKSAHPELDYSEIEELFKQQKEKSEGSYIYTSYWWPKDKLEEVKKINVYSRVYLTEDYWIISVVGSFEEIKKPMEKFILSSIIISVIFITLASWMLYLNFKIIKNTEKFELETKYLTELNISSEKLRKKDAELHHKRQLETIGSLTGGIAHEFNNALTPIVGYSEMCLREMDASKETYDYIEGIYRSSKRAQEIISQIRVFSGDKNIKIKYSPIAIDEIVNETLGFIESVLPSKIKLLRNIEENVGNIYANETQIQQIILNLCTNAKNAMKDNNKGVLSISLETLRDKEKLASLGNRDYIILSIKDNGCGMDNDTLNKIFEPFFTKKLTKKSSGLGLAIVSGIIDKHGGFIEVESDLGIGSTFKIYLPKTNKKSNLIDSELIPEQLIGNEKVLIIDDDEEIVKLLENGLKKFSYKVKGLVNKGELLKEINYIKTHYKVIIVDFYMPELNGIQFSKRIKEFDSSIKIILLTGYSEEPLEEYIKLGIIDSYLMKPVTALELSRNIRKLMD